MKYKILVLKLLLMLVKGTGYVPFDRDETIREAYWTITEMEIWGNGYTEN
jgi:hypothetical protein